MTAEDWAARHRQRHALRRRFMRDFLLRPLGFTLLVKPHVQGLENIPTSGGTILMMNHTIAVDGAIVAGVIHNRFVIPLVKIETMRHWGIEGVLARHWGAVGIQRGEIDREALKAVLDLLRLGELLLIAPEGTRHSQLQQPKDGLAYLALKSGAVIVPTAVYNGETWRKDMFKPRRTQVQVRFGRAFRLRGAGEKRIPRENLRAITDEMMYQLAALLPENYRGEYSDLSRMTTTHLEFLPAAAAPVNPPK